MVDTKSILTSKGVWGGVIAVAGAAAGFFGLTVSGADTASITGHIDSIIAAVGGLLAIWGRIAATKKIA